MASVLGAAALLSVLASGGAQAQTLAYYRFEEGIPGAQTVTQPMPIPDSAPGHSNPLFAFSSDAAPTYNSLNPGSPQNPSAPNTLSVDFSQSTPFTRDLYTGGDPINSHTFNQFTFEASVRFRDFNGFQTFIGKDGQNIPNSGNPALSNLYFQSPNTNIFSIRTHQQDGAFVIVDGTTRLNIDTWYNVAAVMDGTQLSLYLQSAPGQAYTLENSANFNGPMYADNNLVTIGRGEYAGVFTDQFRGLIDEIRISDVALSPSQFLFAPAAVPEPGSIALLLGMGTMGAGLLRRRKQSRHTV